MTTQSNCRQSFVSQDELVCSRRFSPVSRSHSGMAPPLLCPFSEKVDAIWGLAGHKYNKVYLVESSLKLKSESRSSTRNNLNMCHTHHMYIASMSIIDMHISDNWYVLVIGTLRYSLQFSCLSAIVKWVALDWSMAVGAACTLIDNANAFMCMTSKIVTVCSLFQMLLKSNKQPLYCDIVPIKPPNLISTNFFFYYL